MVTEDVHGLGSVMNDCEKGPQGGPAFQMLGSDGDAETEVADAVEVLLDVCGIGNGHTCAALFFVREPATAETARSGGGAGGPGGTGVGLADQVVDLHRGGLARQAGECPTAAIAASEGFGLSISEDVEHDLLGRVD